MGLQRIRTGLLSLKMVILVAVVGLPLAGASAAIQRGRDAAGFNQTMGLVETAALPYSCQYVQSTAAANVLYPGEQASFTFTLQNNSSKPLQCQGKVDLVPYANKKDESIAAKGMVTYRTGAVSSTAILVAVAPGKSQTITVKPTVPDRLGGYGLVVDLGPSGRSFITSFVRTFKPDPTPLHYSQIMCDGGVDIELLSRLGGCPTRQAFGYTPTTDPRFASYFEDKCARLEAYKKAQMPVCVEFGMGQSKADQPLGRSRPRLNDKGVMQGVGGDETWMPSYDPDFKKLVKMVLEKYGWPRGSVIAVKFQNEPWEASSISGWQADELRYREIYMAMAQATVEARKDYGVEVMVGGCDSSSNTFDKLFGDGKDTFLPYLDFCSLHYQDLNTPGIYKPWMERTGPYGRVQIWETEGRTYETNVSAHAAILLAAGYDRVRAAWAADLSTRAKVRKKDRNNNEGEGAATPTDTWSHAATYEAVLHFIGQRKFDQILFKNGLPWVMVFNGLPGADGKVNAEDGTVVVIGDIGGDEGHEGVLFRNAHGVNDTAEVKQLKAKLAALPADAPKKDRQALEHAIRFSGTLSGATMTLANAGGKFHLYDIYGNEMPGKDGKLAVPLDECGRFLRADGQPGSFAALLDAIRHSRVDGIEPLDKKVHDMLSPVDQPGSSFRLELTNVLNRPVKGKLSVQVEGLKVEPAVQEASFGADETKFFTISVSGKARPENTYAMKMLFDAGTDGRSAHEEDLHVNQIARRTINIDGNLEDWKGVLPQTINVHVESGPSFVEQTYALNSFEGGADHGFALGYLAYDEKYFYFATKVADSTPDGGSWRMENRDDDQFFYPAVSYELVKDESLVSQVHPYRSSTPKAPLLPSGKKGERVQADWNAGGANLAVDVNVPASQSQQVALYFLDAGDTGKKLGIEIKDANSGKTLDKQEIHDFSGGVYAVYEISGKIRIMVTGGMNWKTKACLSAVLFDPASAAAPAAGVKHVQAKFVKFDTKTAGDWKGVYGQTGYKLPGVQASLPEGVTVEFPQNATTTEYKWPEGVRRYTYRKMAGSPWSGDTVQIGFNVLDPAKKDCITCPPGTMPGYTGYKDTDYEYCLRTVSEKFGGGTEIWRDNVPGMPHKHFAAREVKSPFDGAVNDGKLAIIQGDTTRIVECAIPWSEIPDVKKRCDAGQPIKFTFRVNDGKGNSGMELARERSVSRLNNCFALRPDFNEHWANEIEFAFEK